jgi:hypothetical protein
MRVTTYHHVEGIQRLEASDHGGYERVAGNFGKDIALVADMLDLLEPDDWETSAVKAHSVDQDAPSTLRRILSAKTLFSSPAFASFNRTSHTRANVPDV